MLEKWFRNEMFPYGASRLSNKYKFHNIYLLIFIHLFNCFIHWNATKPNQIPTKPQVSCPERAREIERGIERGRDRESERGSERERERERACDVPQDHRVSFGLAAWSCLPCSWSQLNWYGMGCTCNTDTETQAGITDTHATHASLYSTQALPCCG